METSTISDNLKTDYYVKEYNGIISMAADLFSLSHNDEEMMRNNNISKIIAKLPFLARCNNPQRTALSHIIITYAASHRSCKKTYLHNLADNRDIFKRLESINNFDGGDEKVLRAGMNLLALIMLADYKTDSDLDRETSKYNPLNSNAWNYKAITTQLVKEIRALNCLELNSLPDVEEVQRGFWVYP